MHRSFVMHAIGPYPTAARLKNSYARRPDIFQTLHVSYELTGNYVHITGTGMHSILDFPSDWIIGGITFEATLEYVARENKWDQGYGSFKDLEGYDLQEVGVVNYHYEQVPNLLYITIYNTNGFRDSLANLKVKYPSAQLRMFPKAFTLLDAVILTYFGTTKQHKLKDVLSVTNSLNPEARVTFYKSEGVLYPCSTLVTREVQPVKDVVDEPAVENLLCGQPSELAMRTFYQSALSDCYSDGKMSTFNSLMSHKIWFSPLSELSSLCQYMTPFKEYIKQLRGTVFAWGLGFSLTVGYDNTGAMKVLQQELRPNVCEQPPRVPLKQPVLSNYQSNPELPEVVIEAPLRKEQVMKAGSEFCISQEDKMRKLMERIKAPKTEAKEDTTSGKTQVKSKMTREQILKKLYECSSGTREDPSAATTTTNQVVIPVQSSRSAINLGVTKEQSLDERLKALKLQFQEVCSSAPRSNPTISMPSTSLTESITTIPQTQSTFLPEHDRETQLKTLYPNLYENTIIAPIDFATSSANVGLESESTSTSEADTNPPPLYHNPRTLASLGDPIVDKLREENIVFSRTGKYYVGDALLPPQFYDEQHKERKELMSFVRPEMVPQTLPPQPPSLTGYSQAALNAEAPSFQPRQPFSTQNPKPISFGSLNSAIPFSSTTSLPFPAQQVPPTSILNAQVVNNNPEGNQPTASASNSNPDETSKKEKEKEKRSILSKFRFKNTVTPKRRGKNSKTQALEFSEGLFEYENSEDIKKVIVNMDQGNYEAASVTLQAFAKSMNDARFLILKLLCARQLKNKEDFLKTVKKANDLRDQGQLINYQAPSFLFIVFNGYLDFKMTEEAKNLYMTLYKMDEKSETTEWAGKILESCGHNLVEVRAKYPTITKG